MVHEILKLVPYISEIFTGLKHFRLWDTRWKATEIREGSNSSNSDPSENAVE